MQNARFIYESIKHPREVGTFIESSKLVARTMAREINGSLHIIEFGAGTGSVTAQILKNLPENGRLTCFEINPKFCEYLRRINDPRLKVINDDAGNSEKYVDCFECIVSALPLAIFEKSKRENILDIASKSKRYIQLQYTPLLKKKFEDYFPDVKSRFVPLNFPPAFIYVCNAFANKHQ